jgi:hypothetical protein
MHRTCFDVHLATRTLGPIQRAAQSTEFGKICSGKSDQLTTTKSSYKSAMTAVDKEGLELSSEIA